jgi:hypothetical protein
VLSSVTLDTNRCPTPSFSYDNSTNSRLRPFFFYSSSVHPAATTTSHSSLRSPPSSNTFIVIPAPSPSYISIVPPLLRYHPRSPFYYNNYTLFCLLFPPFCPSSSLLVSPPFLGHPFIVITAPFSVITTFSVNNKRAHRHLCYKFLH